MSTITVPRGIFKNKELIAVPRSAYEEFLRWRRKTRSVRTFKPTAKELKDLARARSDFKKGDYYEWEDLKHELAHLHSRKSKKTA